MQVLKPHYRVDEITEMMRESLASGWTGYGPMCERFEREWMQYADVPHALFVNSATSGLHLALECLKDGRTQVITTPITFVSTNHAILYAGLEPVFADVDGSLNLDPDCVESLITPDTLAVMFVGVGGNAKNYAEIRDICYRRGVYLVMDGAHMAGTLAPRVFDGVIIAESQVGWDADVSVFSFQAVKNLPTADSGMVCFADPKMHARAKKLSWMGIDRNTFSRSAGAYKWGYDVPEVGYKYNGNDIMACMGLVGLKYLNEDNRHRRALAKTYAQHFPNYISHLDGSSRHLFQILVDDREAVIARLASASVYVGVHYASNKNYPMYRDCAGETPTADAICKRVLSLPMHKEIQTWQIPEIASLF